MRNTNILFGLLAAAVSAVFAIAFLGQRAVLHQPGQVALPGELPLGDAAAGEVLARTYCAPCHDISGGHDSPQAEAPPFAEIVTRWPVEYLAEALAEGITVRHHAEVPMPEFAFEAVQIDDLLAYLEQLKKK